MFADGDDIVITAGGPEYWGRDRAGVVNVYVSCSICVYLVNIATCVLDM